MKNPNEPYRGRRPGLWVLLRTTVKEWIENDAPVQAAALSYYTAFSIAPLLVIAVAVAGFLFGEEAARGEVKEQIVGLVGPSGAEVIEGMMQSANSAGSGVLATLLGLLALFFGATGAFAQLQDSLNHIWRVEPKAEGVSGFLRTRLLSLGLVLGVGFLLLVSLVISAILSGLGNYLGTLVPGLGWIWSIANLLISFTMITVLFAMIYKVLPDVEIRWRDVWLGAAATSLLFTLGKTLIGIYLGRSAVTSTYGAAGAFAIILLWVYYSAQILFFGAQFTRVYASTHGGFEAPKEPPEARPPSPRRAPHPEASPPLSTGGTYLPNDTEPDHPRPPTIPDVTKKRP